MAHGAAWNDWGINRWHSLGWVYYRGYEDQNTIYQGAASTGRLGAFPFVTPHNVSIGIDGLGVLSAGTHVHVNKLQLRLGIYDATSSTNPYPDTLIVDSGAVSVSAAGFNFATFTEVVLAKDSLYWGVSKCVAAPDATVSTLHVYDYVVPWNPVQTTASATNKEGQIFAPLYATGLGTGALPDPFTASVSPTTTGASRQPVIYFRISSVT